MIDTLKLIRNSETMNPCSVSVIYNWHERFRNGRKSTEDDFRDGQPCVVKMTRGQNEGYFIYIDLKNINQT